MTCQTPSRRFPFLVLAVALLCICLSVDSFAQRETEVPTGPIRLRQPVVTQQPQTDRRDGDFERAPESDTEIDADEAVLLQRLRTNALTDPAAARELERRRQLRQRRQQGEFEQFVNRLIEPLEVRRFGSELMTTGRREAAADFNPLVPPDYLIMPGDELVVTIWGSIDADLRLVVDRSGRISIPRVGPVMVSGVRYADLPDVISRRVGQTFKNFQLSVALGQLRGVRVYVTGFVARPGAYTVSSLSTLANALVRAGGPSSAGSFRNIALKRGPQTVATFDLYDLLLAGDRSSDRIVQADDVIHVGPVGPQIALIGSVNKPAIFELKPGDTVSDALRMAGGFTAVADRSRLAVERLDERSSTRIKELRLPEASTLALSNGDILRAFSSVEASQPVARQNKRVVIEGEVLHPGEYVLPAQSTLNDALQAAGGLTPAAYVFGAEFSRESVRVTQQENYERALRDLETDLAKYTSTRRTATADEALAQSAQAAATTRLVERLRAVRPNGRVVLQVPPDATQLPDLALEDGDRLRVPPRATTVGVFGSVFNGGSYLWNDGRQVEDYLRLAGGPTRGADARSVFVVRANGSVVSGRQRGRWVGGGLSGVRAEAGDTIFVPEEMDKTTFAQAAKDWTQILYQLGLGAAAIVTLRNN